MPGRTELRAPPGYAALPQRETLAAIALKTCVPVSSLLLAIDQLFIVQPSIYLHTGVGPSEAASRAVLAVLTVAGWWTTRNLGLHGSATLHIASIGVALSGGIQFWAISQSPTVTWLAQLPSAAAMTALGATLGTMPRAWHSSFDADALARVLLRPFVAAAILACLCCVAVLSNAIGPVRSSLAVAGGLAATAVLFAQAEARHRVASASGAVPWHWLGYALLGSYAIGAYAAERMVPLGRVLKSSHPVGYYATSDRCTMQLSSGQGAYHLFVDGELRISTFDSERWAKSLVGPALARARAPKRALVLSTGEGLIERELLTDPGIDSITSVVRCSLVPELAKHSAWLRQLTRDAMLSPRVAVVQRDPAVFLASVAPQIYDVIIVDLPDPSGPKSSKYYSRYFYRQLAMLMGQDSILVVQATSARRSPRTFATIGATLEAAGLRVQPAIVPLISRGEWSLYFCGKQPLGEPLRPEYQRGTLADSIAEQFFHPWPDCLPPKMFVAEPSTLNDAKVLDWFELESDPAATQEGQHG